MYTLIFSSKQHLSINLECALLHAPVICLLLLLQLLLSSDLAKRVLNEITLIFCINFHIKRGSRWFVVKVVIVKQKAREPDLELKVQLL